MRNLIRKSQQHIGSRNETYFQHMKAAWKIIYLLKTLELKCFIHSFIPGLFTDAVSEKIECLQKMASRNKGQQ